MELHLDAHHSPDILHVQQDITKGISATMSPKVCSAQQTVVTFENELKARDMVDQKSQRGRPSALSLKEGGELQRDLTLSKEKLATLQSQQLAIQRLKRYRGSVLPV